MQAFARFVLRHCFVPDRLLRLVKGVDHSSSRASFWLMIGILVNSEPRHIAGLCTLLGSALFRRCSVQIPLYGMYRLVGLIRMFSGGMVRIALLTSVSTCAMLARGGS